MSKVGNFVDGLYEIQDAKQSRKREVAERKATAANELIDGRHQQTLATSEPLAATIPDTEVPTWLKYEEFEGMAKLVLV